VDSKAEQTVYAREGYWSEIHAQDGYSAGRHSAKVRFLLERKMFSDDNPLAVATRRYFDQLDSAALAEEIAIGRDLAAAGRLVDFDNEE
jgi:hypothetical protein